MSHLGILPAVDEPHPGDNVGWIDALKTGLRHDPSRIRGLITPLTLT